MNYTGYIFWIILLTFILILVTYLKLKNPNVFRPKKRKFNLKNLSKKKEVINYVDRKINELKYSSKISRINTIFIDEKGNFYLGGGEHRKVKNQHIVKFIGDSKSYEKRFNPSNIKKIFHESFGSEDVLIFDPYNPMNINLKPSLNEKNASLMASKTKYDEARLNLEKGIVHSVVLGMDSSTLRVMIFFFISGIGFGLIFGWYVGIRFF